MLKSGYACRIINPNLPAALAGYDAMRISHHIHDPLYAKIVILQDSNEETSQVMFISLDTLTVDEAFTDMVKRRLKRYGFERDQIILSATHTHSGPAGLTKTQGTILAGLEQIFGQYSEEYAKLVLEQIEWAAYEAMENMQEAQIRYYRKEVTGVGGERHFRGNTAETGEALPLHCIELRYRKSLPVLMYSFACHPTILNAGNTSISADLCYGIEQILNADPIRPYGMAVFLNGAAGDQSTRPIRYGSSFEEVERIGRLAATQIQNLCRDGGSSVSLDLTAPLIRTKEYRYPISLAGLPSVEEAEAQLQLARNQMLKVQREVTSGQWQKVRRIFESKTEGAKARLNMVKHMEASQVEWKITKIMIGDLMILTIPGELYQSLAKQIEIQKGFVAGYTNGYYLYMVDELGFSQGDYESMMSPYRQGEGERLVAFINEVILKDN